MLNMIEQRNSEINFMFLLNVEITFMISKIPCNFNSDYSRFEVTTVIF